MAIQHYIRQLSINKRPGLCNPRNTEFRDIISIGNHMISSAILDKSARVNFSKANQIARARKASAMCNL